MLAAVGAHGFPASSLASFTVPAEDWRHPLIQILSNRRHAFFSSVTSGGDRRRRPTTPFENDAFHAMPLRGSGGTEEAMGLLLWSGARRIAPDVEWFAGVFALKLAQLLRRLSLSEGDRKQEYERSLLRAIVNAVTDPILLTDAEGRCSSPTRARSLFVASEEESEGRPRRRMNNMLLSSAPRARRSRRRAQPGASCCSSTPSTARTCSTSSSAR